MTFFKLWQRLSILSLSFIACSALPVYSTELTPENFASSISSGVWFIEHFSPYCGHCRAFAPTWEELSKQYEAEGGVKLAQVNCAVNGDLCNSNGVNGYPQMNLYKNGKFVETFKGVRDLDKLNAFIKRHVPQSQEEEERATDAMTSGTNPNPSGSVQVLDDSNFQNVLDQGPAFIKFYAPWCGHCKKLAPTWKKLAKSMQYKLNVAEVDCEDHKALCKANDIRGFPTLIYFNGNGMKEEYKSGRKLEQLTAFADRVSKAGVKAVKADEIEQKIKEESLVYVLFHSDSDKKTLTALKPLFATLLGSPNVYTVADPPESLTSKFSLPSTDESTWSIAAFKDHDYDFPAGVYKSQSSLFSVSEKERDRLQTWLTLHRLPTALELTQDTFQDVMNSPARPLVVLAGVAAGTEGTERKVRERMEELGRKWRVRTGGNGMLRMQDENGWERPVVFAWMDMEKWSDWLKSMYGIKGKKGAEGLEGVQVVIADHKSLAYYPLSPSGTSLALTSSQSVFSALEAIGSGPGSHKWGSMTKINSESFVERVARFLSSQLESIETYIVSHPMHVLFFVAIGFGIVIMIARRAVADDGYEGGGADGYRSGKGRLD